MVSFGSRSSGEHSQFLKRRSFFWCRRTVAISLSNVASDTVGGASSSASWNGSQINDNFDGLLEGVTDDGRRRRTVSDLGCVQ